MVIHWAPSSTIKMLQQATVLIVVGSWLGGMAQAQSRLLTQVDDQTGLETAILVEINAARTDPAAYASRLALDGEDLLTLPEEPTVAGAVDEAIRFLDEQRPVAALDLSSGLVRAARERVEEATTGEQSPLTEMVERYGSYDGVDETSLEGEQTAQELVRQLILDAAQGDRSPLAPDVQHIGIACQSAEPTCLLIYAEDTKAAAAPLLFEQGVLEPGDGVMPSDGSLYDLYPLEGLAGQTLTVAVESEEFDTVVAVMDANNNIIEQNDDLSDRSSDSSLTVTLPKNGLYYVIVNAYDDEGRGQYTLTVRE